MNITLDMLVELGACGEARRAFEETFGANGAASAREVFEAAAKAGRTDWIGWLQAKTRGFMDAVGDLEVGDYRVVGTGEVEVVAGLVFAYGSATVRAYGSATVEAYDSATVRASDSATVEAYDSATVEAYDSATVEAYDSATVRAYGSATVRAYDSATVLIAARFGSQVRVEIKSKTACAVDRRGDDKPKLVLMNADGKPAEDAL